MAYLDKIDGLGGAVAAIPFMQREIQDAAYRYQQEVESRARVVVGVNEFVVDAAAARPRSSSPIRRSRPGRASACATSGGGATPTGPRGRSTPSSGPRAAPTTSCRGLLDAVRADVTLGEIGTRLRAVFGVHRPSVAF